MQCGRCHRDVPKFARSHIIPKSVMLLGRDGTALEPMVMVPSSRKQRVIRSQTGVWSEIVCPPCEAGFQAGDDALLTMCRNWDKGYVYGPAEQPVARRIYPDIDTATLHRGVLTTLYRAHLSDHEMYQRINLGPTHTEGIRKLLLSGQPPDQSAYGVVLRTVPTISGAVIMSPFRERWDGVNAYRFYFPHVTAMIKVDQKPFPSALRLGLQGAFAHTHTLAADKLTQSEIQFLVDATVGREEEVERYRKREN